MPNNLRCTTDSEHQCEHTQSFLASEGAISNLHAALSCLWSLHNILQANMPMISVVSTEFHMPWQYQTYSQHKYENLVEAKEHHCQLHGRSTA